MRRFGMLLGGGLVVLLSAALAGTSVDGSRVAAEGAASSSFPSLRSAAQPGTPDVPAGFECDTAPLTLGHLLELVDDLDQEAAFNDAGFPRGVTSIAAEEVVQGGAISAEDLDGVTATTRQLVACANAESVLSVAALLTEEFQARLVFALLNEGDDGIGAIAGELPLLIEEVDPDQGLPMIPIRAAWYSPAGDKSVEAILEPYVEGLDEQGRFLVTFAYSEDVWLIDDVKLIEDDPQLDAPAATEPVGTPTGTAASQASPEAAACWTDDQRQTTEGGAGVPSKQYSEPPAMTIDPAKGYTATMRTNKGPFQVELFPQEAPLAVNSFVCLARDGYFDGTPFHRIVAGFVIQGGDPTGTGTGGPGYRFDDEPVTREYERGTLAMANAGPNTNGSQFFVVLEDLRGRLPKNYTIFGRVTEGLEAVDAIAATPTRPGTSGENSQPTEPVTLESVTIAEGAADAASGTPEAGS